MTARAALAGVLLAAACGAAPKSATGPGGSGDVRGVEAAALPFKILRGHGGGEVPLDEFWATLAAAPAVCVGEQHTNPHAHWAQLMVWKELVARGKAAGRPMALGLEMVQRPLQGVLDDYATGKIDEPTFLSRSAWDDRWGYDFALYRPALELARAEGLPILALNARQEITRAVGRKGLASLSPMERAEVPELDLTSEAHRAFFKAATEGHAMPAEGFENFYTAQVIWDETMAETATKWAGAAAGRQIVVLAGTGHCHEAAVPARMARRGTKPAISIQPIIDDGEGAVAELIAAPENDFLFVMSMPPSVKDASMPAHGHLHDGATGDGHGDGHGDEAGSFEAHRVIVDRLIDAALASDMAWQRLEYLTDRIGHRISGSKELDAAIAWAKDTLAKDGHENVKTEPVMVPRWVRGTASASLTAPVARPLTLLALGGSAGTPAKGIEAEVVLVEDLAALEQAGAAVKGKIVLFTKAMPPYKEGETGYGEVSPIRGRGPAKASKLGAIGALVRSLTAHSLRSPHTGGTWWSDGAKPIPAAAITVEDAELIERLAKSGPVRVRLALGAKTLPDGPSANVVAEIRGREKPDEIVLLGAHLDSWDVGQGAHDDGAGVAQVIEVMRLIRALGQAPRRTIRVVLFTNEENGLRGGDGYLKAHAAELTNHVAALESDLGAFPILGLGVTPPAAAKVMAPIAALIGRTGAKKVVEGYGGADIDDLEKSGVPLLNLHLDASTYFDIHHTEADTLDKVDPNALRADVAAIAAVAWVLAEQETPLRASVPKKEESPATQPAKK